MAADNDPRLGASEAGRDIGARQPQRLSDPMKATPTKVLRKLSRERPFGADLWRILEMVTHDDQPDASVVMVGFALLDHGLRDLLLKALPNLNTSTLVAAMFDDEGAPMGSVAAKTRLAHALGLLSDSEAEDLHTLRHIRNAFGHAAKPLTFETPEIATAIHSLNAWSDTQIGDDMTARERFAGVIYMFRFKLAVSEIDWAKVRDEALAFFQRLRTALDTYRDVRITPP